MPDFVDRQRDDGRAVLDARAAERCRSSRVPASEMHGVDDGASGIVLQRGLEHVGFGRVDHQRRFDRLRELAHDARASASSSSARSVSAQQTSSTWAPPSTCSRATSDDVVVVVLEQQPLDLARSLRVDAFADDQRARLLFERDGGHRRCDVFGRRSVARDARVSAFASGVDRARAARRCARASSRSTRRRRSRRIRARNRASSRASSSGVSG